jgi:hypothetical protein
MDESPKPPSLLTILWLVEKRPGMYLGPDDDRGRQLDNLEILISGYFLAISQHGLRDSGVDLYSGFGAYLESRFAWNVSGGPVRAIRREAPSDAVAWGEVWRLLWEYRDAAG